MKGEKFIFTQEQIEYIIENWGKESAHSMKKKFGCSWSAVTNVAKANGLELPTLNEWTNEQIEALKLLSEEYHYKDIAKMMDKTENAIYLKARRLGITLIQDRRKWTKDEEEYLYERWGRDKIEKIARNMRRTVFSVKVKATRMHLGYMSQANIDQISVADISDILGVRAERITDTWIKHGLKLKKKKVSKNYGYYCIDLDNLMLFLKEHQDLWNSQNLEKNILGEESEWLLEKRKRDIENISFEYRIWTEEEIQLAEKLLIQGYNYEQISLQVNHSLVGVACKLRELGYSYRLPRFWKGEELKFLRENYEDMTYTEIAEKLGRTTKAVGERAEELGYQKRLTLRKEKRQNE
ncbi:MAG: hypothetical protein RSD06_04685 [Bacilli bacterium]